MYSRPKPGETEEDLLRLQREFEKNKSQIKPAATVVSSAVKNNTENQKHVSETFKVDIEEQLANTFEAIPSDIKLQNIVEKQCLRPNATLVKFHSGKGFPQAKRRDASITSGKGSIFSQQIKKLKKEEVAMEIDDAPILKHALTIKEKSENAPSCSKESCQTTSKNNLPSRSYILSGSDSRDIHEENLNIMKGMSEEEIREQRERLIASMDPAIVAFLKSRRKKEVTKSRNPTIKEQNEAASNNIEEIQTPSELLMQPNAEKWLNFDIIETNKLAWMKDMDMPKTDKSKQFEARFDFDGWLLPYAAPEINEKNRILYHHGEDPGRPGYTLQELFQLSRSSVIQQKIIAVNCIANILCLNWTGVYDDIIDLPIEQIFFVLRFCLDDNTPAVLNASIKAMRNLICSQVDETCLDSLLGFSLGQIQPVLAIDNDKEDDNTVNDQQLAEKNIIRCLARTEIYTRIRYIINTVKPTLETIVYCMDILVRLSRDSELVYMKILNCEGLIDSIIKYFVPRVLHTATSSPYELPLLQSVKLLRVLSSRSKHIATKFITKYQILDSIALYLSNDTFSSNVNGLRLQTECMHLWSLFINYGLSLDYFSTLQPVLLNMLDYHFKNTNLEMTTTFIRQGHVAALLTLLGHVSKVNRNLVNPFLPLLYEKCLPKWFTQFTNLNDFVCGKLQIISSLLFCLSCIGEYESNNKVEQAVVNLINSSGYNKITDKIKSGSMLLNNYETHKPSNNLKSLEAAAWHTMDHVVPVIQTNSCMPFLYTLSQYVSTSKSWKLKISFLKSPNTQKYLESLQKLKKYYLTYNWFARPESLIIMNILKTSVSVSDALDTSIFYDLSVKCLCVFNSEQKLDVEYLLENIVFCPKFYPSEALLRNLDIGQRNDNLETSLSNLNEILEVYTQVLGLKEDIPDFSISCCIDINIGNVIPIDWIYTPILVLYSNQQNKTNDANEQQQVFTIRSCLRWILIYETCFPTLASTIDPTDRFCRLACVFLGSDSLFLMKEVHDLLELCFKNVMKFESEINFNKKIEGLSNFQDFYTQLLEQYQGVSYGDTLFGNIILVPLAQNQNVQYKKTLWSEYMGAVQIYNVTVDQCMCNLNLFLEPPEDDMSLLTCYKRAVVNNLVRKDSVLFKIAKHHVEMYISRKKQNQ